MRYRAVVVLLGVLLALPARSLPASLPANAECYLHVQLLKSTGDRLRRFERNPLVSEIMGYCGRYLGFRPDRDLLSWIDGNLVVGLVRVGEESPLAKLYALSGSSDYESLSSDLRNLGISLDSYKLDKKRLPKTLNELIPDYLEKLPEYKGVTITYSHDKQGYTINTEFAADSPLALSGKPPLYSEKDGLKAEELAPERHLGLVIAAGCRDRTQATHALERLDAALEEVSYAGAQRWDISWPGVGKAVIKLEGNWVVLCDEAALVPAVMETLEGRAPGLEQNPRYQALSQQLPASDQFSAFLDVSDILEHCPKLGADERALFAAVKAAGASRFTPNPAEARTEAFVLLEPAPNHPLAQLLQSPALGRTDFLSRMPWDTAGFTAIDLGEVFTLLDNAGQTDPTLGLLITESIAKAETLLKVSLSRDLLSHGVGELVISTEYSDELATILRVGDRIMSRTTAPPADIPAPSPEASPSGLLPEAVPLPAPSPEEPPVEPNPGALFPGLGFADIPFTFTLDLRPGAESEAFYTRLHKLLGDHPKSYVNSAVKVDTSADGLVALARRDNTLLLAGGGSSRLLDHILETSSGAHPSVAQLESCQHFLESLKGRPLAFNHTKVDWLYSLLKGGLLMLGSDFRAEATSLGQWRDLYVALSVEPAGVRLSASVYATTQEPTR